MSYFLVAVSNRTNLDLCLKHCLAGFTSSASGLWAYLDIQEGDFISFLYGARTHGLFTVESKAAYKNADTMPPWPAVTFKPSGRTYYFPFRLTLQKVRDLDEPLVRPEFAYVAENLLLRGGYRKTHFQADQTTLQAVSELGELAQGAGVPLNVGDSPTFTPRLAVKREFASPPEVFTFQELFLQAIVRRQLSEPDRLDDFLRLASIEGLHGAQLEVLAEKAFPEGHVDLLLKDSAPKGVARKVVIEVKLRRPSLTDVAQLNRYMTLLGPECVGGVLIGESATKKIRSACDELGISLLSYQVSFLENASSFDALLSDLTLSRDSS